MKSYDANLLSIFAAEQAEHAQRIRAAAEALASAPEDARPGLFDELLRRAHTLKGAARAVGVEPTERVSHGIETLFGRLCAEHTPVDERVLAALRAALDAIEDVLAAALSGKHEPDVAAALARLGTPGMAAGEAATAATAAPSAPPAPMAPEPRLGAAEELVRVSAERIDEVVRGSAQLQAIAASAAADARRAEESLQRVRDMEAAWRQYRRESASYAKVRGEDLEFLPVIEAMDAVEQQMQAVAADAAAARSARQRHAWELEERARELHTDVRRIRMITADAVFGAFGSMVRDMARSQGKQVEYRAEGLEVQADRLVLQGLKDAVMHVLRNAVTHGIETPREREAADKPPAGLVMLRMRARGDRLQVAIDDDGRGFDLRRIASVGVEKGLLTPEEAQTLTDEEAARLVTRPGFSTAGDVTALAGRGMGMSVLREAARAVGGNISVRRGLRHGTHIEISAPLSISTQRVLLLESAGHMLGLPAAAIDRLWRGPASEIRTIEGREALVLDGTPVILARLAVLLDLSPTRAAANVEGTTTPKLSVAVLTSGGERAGLIVDRFLDDRETTVKSLGLPAALAGISAGGVPLEDGSVAVMLDPAAVVERFRTSGAPAAVAAAAAEPESKRRILVVDDSLTTRSLEKSILEAHGFDVRVAVDGMQALEELRAHGADLVITDVMMPRMDGLELLASLKKDSALSAIPVIMVTSMERREDQERGLSLGADAYIVKRKFDQRELLETIRQIL